MSMVEAPPTLAENYRQIIPGVSLGGTPQTQTFLIPTHPDKSLSIDLISFLNKKPATIVANDIFVMQVVLGGPQTNVNNVGQTVTLLEAGWVAVGTTGGLNPPGKAGVDVSGGLRLNPGDDPVFITLTNTTSGNSLAGTWVCLHGWYIPNRDYATFPRPPFQAAI